MAGAAKGGAKAGSAQKASPAALFEDESPEVRRRSEPRKLPANHLIDYVNSPDPGKRIA